MAVPDVESLCVFQRGRDRHGDEEAGAPGLLGLLFEGLPELLQFDKKIFKILIYAVLNDGKLSQAKLYFLEMKGTQSSEERKESLNPSVDFPLPANLKYCGFFLKNVHVEKYSRRLV